MVSVSVIIASYQAGATIERCLGALTRQQTQESFEVIIVDSSADGTAQIIRKQFPSVNLVVGARRLWPGDARNLGVAQARGRILAFTDVDCMADPAWIERIVQAHANRDHPIIGGAIVNGSADRLVDRAFYFCSLNAWMPSRAQDWADDLPTGCLTMTQAAFERFGPFLEGSFSSDSVFSWRASLAGVRPWFEPSVQVIHVSRTTVRGLVQQRFIRGRAYAEQRVREHRWSTARRVGYALLSPVLPLVVLMRIVPRMCTGITLFWQFVTATPLVVLGVIAWSLGEGGGYLSACAGRQNAPGMVRQLPD